MRKTNVIVGCAALLTLFAPMANAAGLGAASDYEVFTFGNFTQSNTDTNGKVAVGGNASLSSFGITASGTSLVVGGNLSYSNSQLNGSAIVGGNASLSSMGIGGGFAANGNVSINGGSINGPLTYGGNLSAPNYYNGTQGLSTSPVNFAAAYTATNTMSQSLYNTASNGTVNSQYGIVTLTGTNAGQNVFNINGSQLASLNTLKIDVPAGATVVINVSGTNVNVTGNYGTSFTNGNGAHNVLFNFAQATSLNLGGSFTGSVLADNAAVTTNYGQLDGQLIAGSEIGNIETHFEYAFDGNLSFDPNGSSNGGVTNTPEMSPFMTAGFGLMSMGVFKRRSRKRA